MIDPITREEQSRTARAVLARHMTLPHPPLSDAERDTLIDAGLVDEGELVPRAPEGQANQLETRWTYVGDRWGVIYRSGRPVLVPTCDVLRQPLSAVQEVERRFASAVLLIELMTGGIMSDQTVAELRREPPWSISFAAAQEEDAQRLAATGCSP